MDYNLIKDLITSFELLGIQVIPTIMTAGFVAIIKLIVIAFVKDYNKKKKKNLTVPSYVWLIVVVFIGIIMALIHPGESLINTGINYATAASFAYQIWEKLIKQIKGE